MQHQVIETKAYLEDRLAKNIHILRLCEADLFEKRSSGRELQKVYAMEAISELNRKIYSK